MIDVGKIAQFQKTVSIPVRISLSVRCRIKFSVFGFTGQLDSFTIVADPFVFIHVRNLISSPVESIEITSIDTPELTIKLSGFLSFAMFQVESFVRKSLIETISSLIVHPNKILIKVWSTGSTTRNVMLHVCVLFWNSINKIKLESKSFCGN